MSEGGVVGFESSIRLVNHSCDYSVNTNVFHARDYMVSMQTLAERLVYARKLRGIATQSELAKMAGVAQGTIGNIESGSRNGQGSLHKIARALRVRLEWLRDGLKPIEATEENDEVVMLPLYDSPMSAGYGSETADPEISKHLAFRADWIRSQGWRPKDLDLYPINGESMTGFAEHGDITLVNRAQRELISSNPRKSVFRVQYGLQVFMKQLTYDHRGAMVLRSFNLDKSRFPDITILGDELDMVRVEGRVVWRGGST